MKIGIAINTKRELDPKLLDEMCRVFINGGFDTQIYQLPDDPGGFSLPSGLLSGSGIIIAFGGDGTLLRCARDAAPFGTPVLGINIGHLGFLTETGTDDLAMVAQAILGGQYAVEERMMLTLTMPDGRQTDALNDAVMSRHDGLRVLYSEVYVNEQLIDSYSSDGVLVASPTGSTAYSLSCGGPVISPRLECLVLCPICPHSLRGRPVVLSPDETARITLLSGSEPARVDADGQYVGGLTPGQSVSVSRSERVARFARLKDRCFYTLLKEKLTQWSN